MKISTSYSYVYEGDNGTVYYTKSRKGEDNLMKKVGCLLMMLALLMSGLVGAGAAELKNVRCEEEGFSTRVPAGTTAVYVKGTGFQVSIGKAGAIPYLILMRRPQPFSNPKNYLNNVFREHMEDQYGSKSRGMTPAKTMTIGGRELIGARYYYMVDSTRVCLLKLIEVRKDGDVEYTIKYVDGKDSAVMEAADAVVRYYMPDGSGSFASSGGGSSGKTSGSSGTTFSTKTSGSTGTVIRPRSVSGHVINQQDGQYFVRITDADRIENGGYFTAELYLQDEYPSEQMEKMKKGDRIEISGRTFTIQSSRKHQDGEVELFPQEDFDGYIVVRKAGASYYTATVNDWTPMTKVGQLKIMLPLPNSFAFVWLAGGEEDATVMDAYGFLKQIQNPDTLAWMTQYNTALQFVNGLPTVFIHSDYPEGPTEGTW